MHRLLPVEQLTEADLIGLYDGGDRPAPPGRPWVLLNMVASVDGATAIDGLSGSLGGDGDRLVFGVIRTVADVIVVAAGTARAENYGPPVARDEAVARRQTRGQPPVPEVAVVTRSAALDPASRLFEGGHRPVVITVDEADVAPLDGAAEIVRAGSGDVDLERALAALHERGHRVALLEGGPTLNGQFVAAGLVDELCLSVAPMVVGGASKRVAPGPDAVPIELEQQHVLEHDGALFLRYRRAD